ncbi:MAG: histidine--tRNA ligase [Actinobacteria bacterium]|nr:histidine--tRNA ligase [Actinomycetota bacterium]
MALSGFPEWLPAGRQIELAITDTARRIFELHGFASIETRSVEPVAELLRKGEIDKEVYGVRRLQGEGDDDLALHFDLTVPLARYVVEHAGHLEFPFRRFQIQKVWRGERPQEGRFREFTQADIDIVGDGSLGVHHEIEMALVMTEVFAALPIPKAVISVNNRKLAEGFYRGVGAEDPALVLRAIDKLDKIGPAKVATLLQSDVGLSAAAANACLALADIRTTDLSFVDRVRALGVQNDLLDEGLDELSAVISGVHRENKAAVVANLRIARGLDYYTGTVYETELVGHESVGSICSGGRYDTLASVGNRVFPGVGISLGVTRLVSILLGRSLVSVSRSVPSAVLVAVNDEDGRSASAAVASTLRSRGIPCEIAAQPDKFGKQIRYAERRGIPFVWFLTDSGGEIKDIRSGDQTPADPATWVIPEDDRAPQVISTVSEEDS